MRIGEIARATDTSIRSLRHYEKQGLIHPLRSRNGYRVYDYSMISLIQRIRWLLSVGLTTRRILEILSCFRKSEAQAFKCPCVRKQLLEELRRIEDNMSKLEGERQVLRGVLGTGS